MKRIKIDLVAVISITLTSIAPAYANSGQGYKRDFTTHTKGNQCDNYFNDHPILDNIEEELVVSKTFRQDGSYYHSRFHNRNPMSAGNKYHECDTTVVAFNALPNGTILRITNPETEVQTLAVVQDKGGPIVTRRPDLSRGLLEFLGGGEAAEEIGLLKGLTYEVVIPKSDPDQ